MLYYVILLYYNFCTLSHFYQVYQNLFDMCPKISKVCNVMNTSIPVEFFPPPKASCHPQRSWWRRHWGLIRTAPSEDGQLLGWPLTLWLTLWRGGARGSWKDWRGINHPAISKRHPKSIKIMKIHFRFIRYQVLCSWKQVFQAISGPQLPSFLTVGWPRVVQHSGAPTNVLRSPYWEVWSPRSMIRTTNKQKWKAPSTDDNCTTSTEKPVLVTD